MRKNVLTLFCIALLFSCADTEPNLPAVASSSVKATKESFNKEFALPGKVMSLDKELDQASKGVVVWSRPYFPKDSIYTLSYGQAVIVYGKTSEYYLVAPQSDTNKLGYLLSGWININN